MYRANRKVTPKVVDGRTQKKGRHALTPSIWNATEFLFEKERPGKGHFHALSKADLLAFFEIIPRWEELAVGLKGVRLIEWDNFDGIYYHAGIICIPAWERELWRSVSDGFFHEHRKLYDRLGVPYEKDEDDDGYWLLKFTEETIRAYQLLHIFIHELGHHVDRMTSRTKTHCARGEHFAENYAFEFERRVWEDYQSVFGVLGKTV